MRTKKVNRYYCDYCKKSGCSAGHLRRHEQGCTNNPNRICKVCTLDTGGEEFGEQRPLTELMAILPDTRSVEDGDCDWYAELHEKVATAMPALRDAASNCPACILAALRQSGNAPFAADFNYKAEMAAIWSEINHSREYANR